MRGDSLCPIDYTSRLQQHEALPRCHLTPSFIRQVSPLNGWDRSVSHLKHKASERGITQLLVVIDGKLAECVVAGCQFPPIYGSLDLDWANLNVSDDDPVQTKLERCIPQTGIPRSNCESLVHAQSWLITERLGVLIRILSTEGPAASNTLTLVLANTEKDETDRFVCE